MTRRHRPGGAPCSQALSGLHDTTGCVPARGVCWPRPVYCALRAAPRLSASQPYRERGRWDIEVPVTGADGPAPARAGTAADPPLLRDLHGAGSRACGGGGSRTPARRSSAAWLSRVRGRRGRGAGRFTGWRPVCRRTNRLDHPLIGPVVWLSRPSVRGREVSARRMTSAVADSARGPLATPSQLAGRAP